MKRAYTGLVILLAAAGCGNQTPQVESLVEVPVTVEEIALSSIEEFTVTTGTVAASKEAVVNTETAGDYTIAINPATGRKFVLGDRIGKGQVIVNLENREQELSINIESKKMQLDIAQNEYEQQQNLFELGGITQSEMRNSERSFMDAQIAYENAEMQLAKLQVKAPIEGIIVQMPYYTEGVRVSSGSQAATIMDYQTLLMETELPSTLLGVVQVGQALRIRNYTMPDSVLAGRITEISPALDTSTRTFTARVSIANPTLSFRPGMFVKAEIITAENEGTVVISKDIILTRRNQKYVYIVDQGFARSRTILTGLENPEYVEVLEGLSPNDRLVIEGYETLRDGSRVSVTM